MIHPKLKQKERNEIAVKISKVLNKQKPKPDIFDCLDILRNIEDALINEIQLNIDNLEEKYSWREVKINERRRQKRSKEDSQWRNG